MVLYPSNLEFSSSKNSFCDNRQILYNKLSQDMKCSQENKIKKVYEKYFGIQLSTIIL